jgi:hypothetical protein
MSSQTIKIPVCDIHHRPHQVVTWCQACRGALGGKSKSRKKRRASRANLQLARQEAKS